MLINVISMNKKSYIVGIFWMIMTSFFFVGVFVTVKYIGDDVPASQSAFLRYLFGTLILARALECIYYSKMKEGWF